MVICGGVNSILTPDTFKALCEARMMSTIGQCQSFCDTADGYARGEGCGIVILKRLTAVCNRCLHCQFSVLTHYQTTNFRPFQTERVCRRQFQS